MRKCPSYSETSGLLRTPFCRSANSNLLCQSHSSCSRARRSQSPFSLSLANEIIDSHVEVFKKMASLESIGACSLDLEASTSSGPSLLRDDVNASEYTLRSTVTEPYINGRKGQDDLHLENGHDASAEKKSSPKDNVLPINSTKKPMRECTVAEIKLPSYVSISCAINGYPNYSKFCRSRENSPARPSFRKTSLESSVLETNQDVTDRLEVSNFRCTRSHSDYNGAINSVFTESRQVTVSKQLQIPLKSTKRYLTAQEIIIGNEDSVFEKKGGETAVNGHLEREGSLAQEVGDGGPKSLVQQRIESLYGQHELKSYSHRFSRRGDHHDENLKVASLSVSKRSPSCPPSTRVKKGDSLPVFRHLTKDFRKQLQGDVSEPSDALAGECSSGSSPKPGSDPVENVKTKEVVVPFKEDETESNYVNLSEYKCNGLDQLQNGHDADECDRAVSSPLPQPKPAFNNLVKPSSLTDIVSAPVCDKEGYRFLDIMDVERRKIQSEIKKVEEYLDSDVPEDACGKIRAACGKANLLLAQKFEQFKELCLKNINENHTDQFYTTASDLAGFWDMVMLQVTDVKTTFKDIETLKENNWKEINSVAQASPINPKPKKHSSQNISKSNPCTPKRSAKSAEMARAREEARKKLIAAKKKGRQQNTKPEENEIAIFVPSNSS